MNESKAKTSPAKVLAQMRYNAKTYDNITVQVNKGMKEVYKQEAKSRGLGLMELFRISVEEYLANHKVNGQSFNSETNQETSAQKTINELKRQIELKNAQIRDIESKVDVAIRELGKARQNG